MVDSRWLAELAEAAEQTAAWALEQHRARRPRGPLAGWRAAYREADLPAPGWEAASRAYAQAVLCGAAAIGFAGRLVDCEAATDWLGRAPCPVARVALRESIRLARGEPLGGPPPETLRRRLGHVTRRAAAGGEADDDPAAGLVESLLAASSPRRRARRGVYYTPPALARFILAAVEQCLRQEFGLEGGFLDDASWADLLARHPQTALPAAARPESPFLRIVDPAAGAGEFFVQLVRWTRQRWEAARPGGGRPSRPRHAAPWPDDETSWRRAVGRLAQRIWGIELLAPAAVVACVRLAAALLEAGYDFRDEGGPQIFVGDALALPGAPLERREPFPSPPPPQEPGPVTVLVGNPPYASLASIGHAWLGRLLRGVGPDGRPTANYYEVNGQPLGERKLWLHDQYVQFLRYAQWRIELAGCGVLGLVANHGYLDNLTFRGVRQQLLAAFPRITVVDLHGNVKKRERRKAERDQSVFATQQGVAIGLCRRPPGPAAPRVWHGELWGAQSSKLRALERAADELAEAAAGDPEQSLRPLPLRAVRPAPPHFFLTPRRDRAVEWDRLGPRLPELFPLHGPLPVTARDSLVVAFTREELVQRMRVFRDLTVADERIRWEFFRRRRRSPRYRPGDTRGWRLAEARRRMAGMADWEAPIRACCYRPLDRRAVYWTPWMVDWPRPGVTRHVLAGPNLVLIARRQAPPEGEYRYVWIADDVPLDGLLRSDNRGGESMFPLYVYDTDGVGPRTRRANLAPEHVEPFVRRTRFAWREDGAGDLERSFGPEDVFHYIYAVQHATSYRRRWAEQLEIDFPRIPAPESPEAFRRLSRLGARLAALHLGRCGGPPAGADDPPAGVVLGPGLPRFVDGRVEAAPGAVFAGVSAEAWAFRAGAHQVLRKWLTDRRGRALSAADVAAYRQAISAVSETLAVIRQIDAVAAL